MTKANAHEREQAKRMYQCSNTLSQCVGKWVPLVPNGFPIYKIGISECFKSLGQKMQIVNNIPTKLFFNFVKVLKCRYWKCVTFSIWRFETQVVNKKKGMESTWQFGSQLLFNSKNMDQKTFNWNV